MKYNNWFNAISHNGNAVMFNNKLFKFIFLMSKFNSNLTYPFYATKDVIQVSKATIVEFFIIFLIYY